MPVGNCAQPRPPVTAMQRMHGDVPGPGGGGLGLRSARVCRERCTERACESAATAAGGVDRAPAAAARPRRRDLRGRAHGSQLGRRGRGAPVARSARRSRSRRRTRSGRFRRACADTRVPRARRALRRCGAAGRQGGAHDGDEVRRRSARGNGVRPAPPRSAGVERTRAHGGRGEHGRRMPRCRAVRRRRPARRAGHERRPGDGLALGRERRRALYDRRQAGRSGTRDAVAHRSREGQGRGVLSAARARECSTISRAPATAPST